MSRSDTRASGLTVSVVGTGYLGAVHAVAMAELGHTVVGVDVDAHRIAELSAGRLPFWEPEVEAFLATHIASGRLTFTTDAAHAASVADIQFLCLGTPQRDKSGVADLRYLEEAVDTISAYAKPGALIVGKSTVPVGTTRALERRFASAAPERSDVEFAWNPEFLREGFAWQDSLHPDRIVVGVASAAAERRLREVYAPLIENGSPFVVMDVTTSELVKVAANAFLATKVSFINAMAEICETTGGDVNALAAALRFDERIGSKFLQPGIGFGGGCLPKDLRAFAARAEELGVGSAVGILREADAVNQRSRERVLALAVDALDGVAQGKIVTVLGATFKPNSDDVRDSPALWIATRLHEAGASVRIHDPKGIPNARRLLPKLTYVESLSDALNDAEAVLHLTEWQEYRTLNPTELAAKVKRATLVDGRNILDREVWTAAGWTVHSPGRPSATADTDPAS